MSPMMIWDADMKFLLGKEIKAGRLTKTEEYIGLPVEKKKIVRSLPKSLRRLFRYANGMEIRWQSTQIDEAGGRLQFLKVEQVLQDWKGQIYEEEDLLENDLIQYFKPIDLVTDEAQCGFLNEPGFKSKSIYYNRSGEAQLYDLDLNFKGYLEMALASCIYYYWPKVLLDIQSGEESVEMENFKVNMPKIFPDFSWDNYVAQYQSLRLSRQ